MKTQHLGPGSWRFEADDVNLDHLKSDSFRTKGGALRGSVMILGPMLGRFGIGAIPRPGGDKIGRRRMDTHFIGFQKLGAEFSYDAAIRIFQRQCARRIEGHLHVARRGIGHGHRQCRHGGGAGRGHDHDLQRGVRALPAAAVQDDQPHGRKDQRRRFEPVDHRRRAERSAAPSTAACPT